MKRTRESTQRAKHIAIGASVLLGLGLLVSGALIGRHYLPGVLGEWAGTMVGVMTTPFFLEASFVFIGLFIVFLFNAYRRNKEGDEYVYLEQVEGKDGESLPEHAKWAVYRDKPLDGEEPDLLDRVEGAVAVEDWDEAASLLGDFSEVELALPRVLEARLALAKATGKQALVDRLELEIRAQAAKPSQD